MSEVFIVANFKSFKTENEAKEWLNTFLEIKNIQLENKKIILCPSFTLLSLFSNFIKENSLPVSIGAQNVSQFDQGAYTGEINAKQIKDFCEYVLIGHSERRINFKENDDVLASKTKLSQQYNLKPIFFIQDENNKIPQDVSMVSYEPVFAIGTGKPDSPKNANLVSSSVNSSENKYNILYGGSVNSSNVKSFTSMNNISGVVVGGASLDPKEFIEIIKNA